MSARDHLRLGPDGKYIWVEDPEAYDGGAEPSEAPNADEGHGGAGDAATGTRAPEKGDIDPNSGEAPFAGRASRGTDLTSISSSLSGPGIGDDVAAKRANLVNAQGTPRIGRRESPEPYDPRPTRIMYAKGLIAGAVVILIVIGIMLFIGADYSIA